MGEPGKPLSTNAFHDIRLEYPSKLLTSFLLTLEYGTECIFSLKEEERWRPSRLDKWHAEPGSV